MLKELKKPENLILLIVVSYVIYKLCFRETFTQPSLRSPVSIIPTERFSVEPTSSAAKLTVVSTNLNAKRRGLLSPQLRGGETRNTKNIRQDIRALPSSKIENYSSQNLWNASEVTPEQGVRNRYL